MNHSFRNGNKERNVLFNGALNTFYLWLYGMGHMLKDHSDGERERKAAPATTWATLSNSIYLYGFNMGQPFRPRHILD